MKKTNSLFLLLLVLSLCTQMYSQEVFPPIPQTPVVAHRGFSAFYPENTTSSIMGAIKSGAQGCEMDLRRTSDGVIVLSHDASLKRTAGIDKKISDLTFGQLRNYEPNKCKKEFDGKFKGEKVPTFEAAMLLLKGTKCRPVIEVKEFGFEKEVVDMIRKHKMEKTAVIIDFEATRVKKYREFGPEICTAWLCSYKQSEYTPEQMAEIIIKTLKECHTNVVDIAYSSLSPELLKKLRDANISVWCWTVDNKDDIRRMINWKIESITTNRPDIVLEERAK